LVQAQIIGNHRLGKSQHQNALKQARQIRYALQQAKEYYEASTAVSLATRPLLLYYCAMSLAFAEVLYKHTGDSSMDRLRGKHAHHGLEAVWARPLKASDPIEISAAALTARRHKNSKDEGIGTFELWHQSAREHPLGGKHTTSTPTGNSSKFLSLFAGSDARFPLMPASGISLLDCYKCLPGMASFLAARGQESDLVRATIRSNSTQGSGDFETNITFHPAPQNILSDLYSKIHVQPIGATRINIIEHTSGLTLRIKNEEGDIRYGLNLPQSIQHEESIIHFLSRVECLNEFGLMYVGLYILGMYARYYPDRWMVDVESSSDLASSAFEFLDLCEARLPFSALAEFSGVAYVRAIPYL
jgi:hypothetical protein